ncbi:B12-binding domain-containing radical SAM protein [Motiliproteus sediminis]|uniref:B12-binding domain-containing radical SAM protein n=1 Tax=Motiliproteus sediminis TaxID=1468178 RepID=UPI001AEFB436|nr:hypothetical protein [Motiliproteus sediminis]
MNTHLQDASKGVLLVRAQSRKAAAHPRHRHPPLSLLYAQAGLERAGLSCQLWDQWVRSTPPELDWHPSVVVVMGQSECLEEAAALARWAGSLGAKTVAVGQQAYHYRDSAGVGPWDCILEGEFELALAGVVVALLQPAPRLIQGKRYQRVLVDDPDQLPRLSVSMDQLDHYPFPLPVRGRVVRRWGYVQTAWGCPYACDHCTDVVRKSSGSRLRRRRVGAVLDDIAVQLQAGAEGIVFEDDTLFCSPAHLRALCDGIAQRGWDFPWVANARPDELDEARVALAAGAGAVLLKLGIETADSSLAQAIGKHRSESSWRELCESGLQRLQQHGIGALALLMTGMPGETADQHQTTRGWLRRQPLDYVQVQLFTSYPEIQLAVTPGSEGGSHYRAGDSPERQRHLRWQQRLYRGFYLRAGFARHHLRHHWRWYLRPSHWVRLLQQAAFVLSAGRSNG